MDFDEQVWRLFGERGQWLHVDFEDRLQHFYVRRCGFRPTHAGLIEL